MMNSDYKREGWGGRGRMWKVPFFVLGFVAIKSGIVLFLWNALIPELFHGPQVDYFQAVGLVVLAKLLVGGGFRPGGGHWGGMHRRGIHGGGRGDHRFPFSKEDREKLREEFRKRTEPQSE